MLEWLHMKKILLLGAAIALMGQGCLSFNQQAETTIETGSSDAKMEGSMEADAMMGDEDSKTGDEAMMEEDGGLLEGSVKLDGSVMLDADAMSEASIADFAFQPKVIRAKQGAKIIFTNQDAAAHTVTADGGAFGSALLQRGDAFTLDTGVLAKGEYPYHCEPHPFMTGTIIVE